MVDRTAGHRAEPGTALNAVVHGGNLHEAAERYGIPYAQWLDLSTGINPHGYPVPPVPALRPRPDPMMPPVLIPQPAASPMAMFSAETLKDVLPNNSNKGRILNLPSLSGL